MRPEMKTLLCSPLEPVDKKTARLFRAGRLELILVRLSLHPAFTEGAAFGGAIGPDFGIQRLDLCSLFERGLSGGQTRHRHAERRATHVGQAEPVAELHAVRVAAVFAADAELDVGAGAAAFFDGDLHQLADAGLIDRGERILLHDFQFLIRRQERAGIVAAHAQARFASGRWCRS